MLDCDVLQADGGTRTAAITGAYVALADAVAHLRSNGALTGEPLTGSVAAVSVGIIDGVPRLDLPYVEDVRAETDMNVVMTGDGKFVEVQGTAEGAAFDRAELDALLDLAEKGCADLTRAPAGGARPVRIFLASRNAKKILEMQRILAEHVPGIEVLGIDDVEGYVEPVEDQPTFEGNALLKARAGRRGHRAAVGRRRQRAVRRRAERHAGGALGPVVRARPRATQRNNELLLAQLDDVPDERRGAHFACAVAWADARRSRARRRGPDGRSDHPRAAGERRLRLRRGLRRRRARRRRTSPPPSSSRARRTASRTAAGRCASSRRTSRRTCQAADTGSWADDLARDPRRPTGRRRRT